MSPARRRSWKRSSPRCWSTRRSRRRGSPTRRGGGAENVDAPLGGIDDRSQHPEPAAGKPSGAGDGRLQELVSQQQEIERKEERARTLWSELRAAPRQLEELERQIAMRTEQLQAAEQQAGLQRRLEDLEKELREHQDLLNRL